MKDKWVRVITYLQPSIKTTFRNAGKRKIIIVKFLLLFFLAGCAREYSCEGCRESRPLNDLVTFYNIPIAPTSVVRIIYPSVKHKLHPGHYEFFDSIKVVKPDTVYSGSYDLKKYCPMDKFIKGDTFFVFYELRGRAFTEQVQHDTLIY